MDIFTSYIIATITKKVNDYFKKYNILTIINTFTAHTYHTIERKKPLDRFVPQGRTEIHYE